MKPRLEPARYTDEDWDIMRALSRRWMFEKHPGNGIAHIYVPSDRRDADLMLVWRRYLQGQGISPAEWQEFCQGWDYVGPTQWYELYEAPA